MSTNPRSEIDPLHDTTAEFSLLGSILQHNARRVSIRSLVIRASAIVQPEDFYLYPDSINGRVFAILQGLIEEQKPADVVTIYNRLQEQGQTAFQSPEGLWDYLLQASDLLITSDNLEHYAEIIRKKSRLRALQVFARNLYQQTRKSDAEPDGIAADALKNITPLLAGTGDTLQHIGAVMQEHMVDAEARMNGTAVAKGIETGYGDLDILFAPEGSVGMARGDIGILAARPSVGKTGLAVSLGIGAAKHGYKVLMFSAEMRNRQVIARVMASESGVNSGMLRGKTNQSPAWNAVADAYGRLRGVPFWIDEQFNLTPAYMRSVAQNLSANDGLDLIILDYLQLMSSGKSGHDGNRNLEVAYISRSLKHMAKEFKVPILVLSQLSRAVEKRENKRPILSDLRDSGAIEQDADVVAFLHRDEYVGDKTDPRSPSEIQNVEVIFRKSRNGGTGVAMLHFTPAIVRFESASIREEF